MGARRIWLLGIIVVALAVGGGTLALKRGRVSSTFEQTGFASKLEAQPRSMKSLKPYDWKKEQERLWSTLVPANGQADTLQGELIRIAGKLTDQAFRNGNGNWDDEHERMWRFVGTHLNDPATFTAAELTLIQNKIEEIIRDKDRPDVSGDGCCYYVICEKVVDWCMAHPTTLPRQKDPTLKR